MSECVRRTGFPLSFWEQLANAVSMVIANLYIWRESQQILDGTSYEFDVEIIRFFALLHCPCSISYHVTLMWRCRRACSLVDRNTWTRVLDMGAIHVCCAAYGLALSHGASPWFVAVNSLVIFESSDAAEVHELLVVIASLSRRPSSAATFGSSMWLKQCRASKKKDANKQQAGLLN